MALSTAQLRNLRLSRYINERIPRSGAVVHSLEKELALPSDTGPLIRELLARLIRNQMSLSVIEAGCNGTPISLAQKGLHHLMTRSNISISQFLACLFNMPNARQLLVNLLFVEAPPEGCRTVQINESVRLRARLHDYFQQIVGIVWRLSINKSQQLTENGVSIQHFDPVAHSGSYECIVFVVGTNSKLPFTTRLQPPPSAALPQQLQTAKPLFLRQDINRTNKFALIVRCAKYLDCTLDLGTDDGGITELTQHLIELGYRCIVLSDPTRIQLLCAVRRLRSMLTSINEWDHHVEPTRIFLLLDGHGLVTEASNNSENSNHIVEYFQPSDTIFSEQNSSINLVPIEEEILQPLADTLTRVDGSLAGSMVAVIDACRRPLHSDLETAASRYRLILAHNRIDRLYTTCHGGYALTPEQGPSIGVQCLLNLLAEAKTKNQPELLLPSRLLEIAANHIRNLNQRSRGFDSQLLCPERSVVSSGADSSLASLALLSDPLAIAAASRVSFAAFKAQFEAKFALIFVPPALQKQQQKLRALLHLLGFHVFTLCGQALLEKLERVTKDLKAILEKIDADCPTNILLVDAIHGTSDDGLQNGAVSDLEVLATQPFSKIQLSVARGARNFLLLIEKIEQSLLQQDSLLPEGLPLDMNNGNMSLMDPCLSTSSLVRNDVAEMAGKMELEFDM